MTQHKYSLISSDDVGRIILQELEKNKKSINIFCSGHFLLVPDKSKQKLVPAIIDEFFDDSYYEYLKHTVGIFPEYTWQLATSIVEKCKGIYNKNLLSLLINDWQLVPIDEQRQDLSKPNSFREKFYASFEELPKSYSETLKMYNLTFNEDVYKTPANVFYLKEVSLRDRFMRKAKTLLSKSEEVPVGMCSLSLDDCGNIKMQDEDNASHQLSTNSKAGCAAGITQMILDLYSQFSPEYEEINFINLMPSGCTNPVNIASELAINMIQELKVKSTVNIVNFYFDGSGTTKPEDFYNKENNRGVTGYTFTQ